MNSETFLLERYKYILEQKRTLNEATFKIVSLFQVVIAAVAAGDYKIIKSAQSAEITSSTAVLSINILYFGFILAGVTCLCLLIGGVVSWLDYRADESRIEMFVHGSPKAKINILGPLRWYETYIALTMLAAIVGYSVSLPLISSQCEQKTASRSVRLPHSPKPASKI